MSDIFISYANSDRDRILPLVEVLEREGWSVWWDRLIPVGKSFDEIIEAEINNAKCIIVIWSNNSVQSRWVKTEASEGAERGVLFPVIFDNVKLPFEFRRIHAAQLTDWNGDVDNQALVELLNSLASIIGARATQSSTKNRRDTNQEEHSEEAPTDSSIFEQAGPVVSDDEEITPDSNAHAHTTRNAGAPPTEITSSAPKSDAPTQLPHNKKAAPVPPLVAAPTQIRGPQEAAQPFPSMFDLSVAPRKGSRLVYIAVPLTLLLFSFGSYLLYTLLSNRCPVITIDCWAYGDKHQATCILNVEEERASSRNYSQDTGQLLSSLQALAVFQIPQLPKTVTDVSWSVSSGRVRQYQEIKNTIDIDTTGLSGQEITATATVSGYSKGCSSTVSDSFIAK